MKAILYLLGGILVAPGAVLAYGFWTLSEAIRQGNLFQFLSYLLERMLQMLVWEMGVWAAVIVVWIALAFWRTYRWIGALGMAMVATISLVEFFAATGWPRETGELFIPVISLVGLGINLWLVGEEWRAQKMRVG